MFKIFFSRNLMGDTPRERNKITGIHIRYSYQCTCFDCEHFRKCKYRKSCKFHNWSVGVHRFFEYKLHIKLPHWLYIDKLFTDLSGTTTCPFNMPRQYTCHVCKYQAGYDEHMKGLCNNEDYINSTWSESHIDGSPYCKFFEKDDWADKYDKKTGEVIFDSITK